MATCAEGKPKLHTWTKETVELGTNNVILPLNYIQFIILLMCSLVSSIPPSKSFDY